MSGPISRVFVNDGFTVSDPISEEFLGPLDVIRSGSVSISLLVTVDIICLLRYHGPHRRSPQKGRGPSPGLPRLWPAQVGPAPAAVAMAVVA